jgi:hypothetical protein
MAFMKIKLLRHTPLQAARVSRRRFNYPAENPDAPART